MSILLKGIISFAVCFVVVLSAYLLIINKKRKDYTDGKYSVDILYIVNKFKLDMRKTKYKTLKTVTAFINSFIVAFTFAVVTNLKYKYFFKLLIAFVMMFTLIYSLYEITGRIFKKKENKDS